MRVQLIDPSADVLPYDHALAAALARRGTQVELVTSRFVHGPVPAPGGYEVSESFYRLATWLGASRPPLRRALKALEHLPGTMRVRRRPPALAVALARGAEHPAPTAWPPAGAHHAQRDPARAVRSAAGRANGRDDRPHAPGGRAAGRRPACARDPARGVRAPHATAGRAPAAARAGRGGGPGRAVLRRRAAVQGGRRAGGFVQVGRGRRAVGGGAAAGRVDRGARRARGRT